MERRVAAARCGLALAWGLLGTGCEELGSPGMDAGRGDAGRVDASRGDAGPSWSVDAGFTPIPDGATVFVPPDQPLVVDAPRGEPTCEGADEELLMRCGALRVTHVAPTGRAGATGEADDPFDTLQDALARCGPACEVRVAVGTYTATTNVPISACVRLSGGWRTRADRWTHDGERSTVTTGPLVWFAYSDGRLLVEHFDITGPHSALGGMGDLLVVRDVDIVAVSTGIALGDETDARICRTSIRAGYTGLDAERATDVLLHEVSLEGRQLALNLGTDASRVVVSDSTLTSEAIGIAMTQTSHVRILRSTIESLNLGVFFGDEVSYVLVEDSEIAGCQDAIVVRDGAWNLQLSDTALRSGCP